MARKDLKLAAYQASFLPDSEFRGEILKLARRIEWAAPYCVRVSREELEVRVAELERRLENG